MKNFFAFAALLFALLLSTTAPATAAAHFAPTTTVAAEQPTATVNVQTFAATTAASLTARVNATRLNEGELVRLRSAARLTMAPVAPQVPTVTLSTRQQRRLAQRAAKASISETTALRRFSATDQPSELASK